MTTTKTTTIPRGLITDALDAAGLNTDIREDYSGRGMFGDRCVAVVFDSVTELVEFAFQLGAEGTYYEDGDFVNIAPRIEQMLSRTRTDSMGTGIVAYWPGYSLTKE